jgi:hypothetical protein
MRIYSKSCSDFELGTAPRPSCFLEGKYVRASLAESGTDAPNTKSSGYLTKRTPDFLLFGSKLGFKL